MKLPTPVLTCIVIALAVPGLIGLSIFKSQEKWKQDLQLAWLHDANPLEEDQVLVPTAMGECELYHSPQTKAEILVWTTLHFNERNAHASEQLAETAFYNCKAEYVALAMETMSGSRGDKLDLRSKRVLQDFATELEMDLFQSPDLKRPRSSKESQ
jgi:hypothetical protein